MIISHLQARSRMNQPTRGANNQSVSQSTSTTQPNLQIEQEIQKTGLKLIAGVDEAGRGAWAGPVVAAAVVLPVLDKIHGLALAVGVGIADVAEINRMGVGQASFVAMQRAVDNLEIKPEHILVDG